MSGHIEYLGFCEYCGGLRRNPEKRRFVGWKETPQHLRCKLCARQTSQLFDKLCWECADKTVDDMPLSIDVKNALRKDLKTPWRRRGERAIKAFGRWTRFEKYYPFKTVTDLPVAWGTVFSQWLKDADLNMFDIEEVTNISRKRLDKWIHQPSKPVEINRKLLKDIFAIQEIADRIGVPLDRYRWRLEER